MGWTPQYFYNLISLTESGACSTTDEIPWQNDPID